MRRRICTSAVLLFLIAVFSLKVFGGDHSTEVIKHRKSTFYGVASYYHSSLNGNHTYNGERYRNSKLTAAHKTLPMGTLVRVTDLRNDRTVIVRINDRLPRNSKRMIDLSQSAAKQIHIMGLGLAHVKMEILPRNHSYLATL